MSKGFLVSLIVVLIGCDAANDQPSQSKEQNNSEFQLQEPIWAWAIQSSLHELCVGEPRGELDGRWEIALLNNIPVDDFYFSLVTQGGGIKGRLACSNIQEMDAIIYEAKAHVESSRLILDTAESFPTENCGSLELKRFDERVLKILSRKPKIVQDGSHLCLRTDDGEAIVFNALPRSVSAFNLVRDPARKQ